MELTRSGDTTSNNHKNGVEAAKEGIFSHWVRVVEMASPGPQGVLVFMVEMVGL